MPHEPKAGSTGNNFPVRVRHPWYLVCKTALERTGGAILLVLSLPVILVAGILVKLTSRGPVFYRQKRAGLDGQPFELLKIRTMTHDCEKHTGPVWSQPGDPRVTRVGRVLRDFHIDELPQLWNVVRGQMSIVGPRPERPEIIELLENQLPLYRGRLLVKPGLTGLAQLQLPADSDLSSVRRKLAHDLYYVGNVNPWLDFRLCLGTACYLFRIPFRVTGRWLALPRGPWIEEQYLAATRARHVQAEIDTRPDSDYPLPTMKQGPSAQAAGVASVVATQA